MIEKVKTMLPINFALIGNPVNWIIVVLMIASAGLAISLIFNDRIIGEKTNGTE